MESAVTIGVVACLILMSAGIIFNPKTVEDIKSIGQSFQNHMYQWGTEAEKLDEVETWFGGLHLLDPDDDDEWSPNKTTIRLARGLLAGISLWVAGVALATKKVEDTSQTAPLGFRYLRISNDYLAGNYRCKYNNFLDYGDEILSLFQTSFYNNLAVIYCAVDTGLFGWFWDNGELKTGLWKNPDGIIHASDFGVYPLGSLELIEATGFNVPIFFSKELAESQADFLYGEYRAVYWENSTASIWSEEHELCLFEKRSVDSTWFTTVYDGVLSLSLLSSFYVWGPDSMNDVVWDQVAVIEPGMIVGDIVQDLESGELSEEDIPLQDLDVSLILPYGQSVTQSLNNVVQQFYGGDMTLDEYLELIKAADEGAAAPSVVVNIPMNNSITYYQNAQPSAINVLATSPDGGNITYEWYRYGTDPNGKVYPVEVLDTDSSFLPMTDQLGTSHYYCRIYNTDPSGMVNYVHTPSIKIEIVADPNAGTVTKPDVGTDTEANKALADAIGQSVSDALKNQNTQSSQDAMNTGNDVSQDLLDAVPDHSTKFLPYIRDLANSMGYTGTTCVLTMPAITVPAVGAHFKETTVLQEQQINFEDYFNKMPELLITIVRAIFDIAIVFFCLREFNHTIQQVLTGFKDMKDDLEDF